MNMPL